jgi:hypothetical protein
VHYSNKIFSDPIIRAGNQPMPTSNGTMMMGNMGDGHLKIQLLDTANCEPVFCAPLAALVNGHPYPVPQ